MYSESVSFILKKSGAVVIQNTNSKLACIQNKNQDNGNELGSLALWVKNTHELFQSDEATGWLLVPAIETFDTDESTNLMYIEMHQGDDHHERLRLCYNEQA